MEQEIKHSIRETGQLRRAKMHLSSLIEQVDNNKAITPFLKKLLETGFILQTTNSMIIANHLKYSPVFEKAFNKYLKFLECVIRKTYFKLSKIKLCKIDFTKALHRKIIIH